MLDYILLGGPAAVTQADRITGRQEVCSSEVESFIENDRTG